MGEDRRARGRGERFWWGQWRRRRCCDREDAARGGKEGRREQRQHLEARRHWRCLGRRRVAPPSQGGCVSELPFVSCIMPTRNRTRFVAKAIDCFMKQDYPRKQ